MSRLCKNHITDHIREQFGANPLRTPQNQYQPMSVLEIRKRKPDYLGDFSGLVKGGFNHIVPTKTADVSSVSDNRSNTVDYNIGLNILAGYLQALKIDPAAKVHKKSNNEIEFEGPEDLTFAFDCLEIIVEPSGNFVRGEWFDNIRARDASLGGGQIPGENEMKGR